MFELIHCRGNTYYFKCFSNAGVYDLGNGEVILIDSCDHKKSYTDLDKCLEKHSFKVKAIINTHSHADHIAGNRYFVQKYNCKVYGSEIEHHLACVTDIEGQLCFNGYPINRQTNYFFKPLSVNALSLDELQLPNGFEIISLPGHSYQMVGIITPDDVFFVSDSVLAQKTLEACKLPIFLNYNKSIETMKFLSNEKASLFVPAHADVTDDISELALFNANWLEEVKDFVFSISNEKTFEQLFEDVQRSYQLKFNPESYGRIAGCVRSALQGLIDEGRLNARVEDYQMIYYAV